MEAITIPSPSAFLRSPVVVEARIPRPRSEAAPKRSPTNTKTSPNETKKDNSAAKPKQSKSRNGCITCKAKRLKCDETKPSCQQCHKRSVTCGGYKKDFKWRPFEEASFTGKAAPTKTKKAFDSNGSTRPVRAQNKRPRSPSFSDEAACPSGTDLSLLRESQVGLQIPFPQSTSHHAIHNQPFPEMGGIFSLEESEYLRPGQSFQSMASGPEDFQPSSATSTIDSLFDNMSVLSSTTATSSFPSEPSRIPDLLPPDFDLASLNLFKAPLEQPPIDMQEEPQSQHQHEMPGEEVEEVIRNLGPTPDSWIVRLPSPTSSESSVSSEGSVRSDPFNALYRQPDFQAHSPEMLMLRFDRQTCGILSVKDGPTENPWRTLIWPLARDSPALYHAISSMTAFHTSKYRHSLRVEGIEHMRRSISNLASGIGDMRTDTALATTLVLAFSESWDQHISTGIEHLRGARILVNQALAKHQQAHLGGDDLKRLQFLCNTWVYMDVIARLTSINVDESNDFDNVFSSPGVSFSENSEVDPLMGCASTLFPLIGRVANLVRRVRKSESNSAAVVSQAIELKSSIETWRPPSFFNQPEDPTSEVQHSLQTAEAYRWATLLYLHQAVPEIPSESSSELAKRVLVYLATVPLASRAVIVQIYPLLAAGCEASTQEDRQWVEYRWKMMGQRMLIGVIDRCLDVVREVWDRRDAHKTSQRRQRRRHAPLPPMMFDSAPLMKGVKRTLTAEDEEHDLINWTTSFGRSKRRATNEGLGMPAKPHTNQGRRRSTDISAEAMDPGMTVRGRMHWVGVMEDWKWEGKFPVSDCAKMHLC
ncbi:MAG: hypothetical protein M1819_004113 [Sarea resinae]|nr:MAG: hypothetical protein M1819_004113 [Sarea resinae]